MRPSALRGRLHAPRAPPPGLSGTQESAVCGLRAPTPPLPRPERELPSPFGKADVDPETEDRGPWRHAPWDLPARVPADARDAGARGASGTRYQGEGRDQWASPPTSPPPLSAGTPFTPFTTPVKEGGTERDLHGEAVSTTFTPRAVPGRAPRRADGGPPARAAVRRPHGQAAGACPPPPPAPPPAPRARHPARPVLRLGYQAPRSGSRPPPGRALGAGRRAPGAGRRPPRRPPRRP